MGVKDVLIAGVKIADIFDISDNALYNIPDN
ncbi:MAG: hypothetical protein ACI9N3_001305 [Colwellia sp.]|jgi:hypothetical protein